MQTAVKERPLIMTGKSVRGIFAGIKTHTRRTDKALLKFDSIDALINRDTGEYFWRGWYTEGGEIYSEDVTCPKGQPGDRLWIKETWLLTDAVFEPPCDCVCYRADLELRQYGQIWGGVDTVPISFKASSPEEYGRWQSPLFMPRDHSRLLLEIKDIKVERVCSISPADARKEGYSDINEFFKSWDELNAKRGFSAESNPFVWVIEFEPVKEKE